MFGNYFSESRWKAANHIQKHFPNVAGKFRKILETHVRKTQINRNKCGRLSGNFDKATGKRRFGSCAKQVDKIIGRVIFGRDVKKTERWKKR